MIFNKLLTNQKLIYEKIISSIKNSEPLLMTYMNQHCYNIYKKNDTYKNFLNKKFNVFLDGYGLYMALRFLGFNYVQKFNATDLYLKVFNYLSTNQYRLFLIGGSFSGDLIHQKASESKLAIVGYQTGYFDDVSLSTIIDKINESSTKIIIIGMGVPKQEFLASEIAKSCPDKVILCVGNFLEFYFGTKRRASRIFRSSGLEWFHRLLTEPKRLWKRYLIGIPVFIFHIIKLKYPSTGQKFGNN